MQTKAELRVVQLQLKERQEKAGRTLSQKCQRELGPAGVWIAHIVAPELVSFYCVKSFRLWDLVTAALGN